MYGAMLEMCLETGFAEEIVIPCCSPKLWLGWRKLQTEGMANCISTCMPARCRAEVRQVRNAHAMQGMYFSVVDFEYIACITSQSNMKSPCPNVLLSSSSAEDLTTF